MACYILPTSTPGGPSPTGGTDVGGGDRWKISGKVEYYDNLNLAGATVRATYSDNSYSEVTTNAQGIFAFNRKRSEVPEGNYTVTASKTNYRTIKAKGTIGNPGNCTKVSDDTGWRCSKDRGNTNGDAEVLHNFEEVAPAQPNASISKVNNLTLGQIGLRAATSDSRRAATDGTMVMFDLTRTV